MRKLLIVLLSSLALAQAPQRTTYNNNGAGYAQGATIQIPNAAGSQAASFEYLFNNTPAAVSITIQGCMRGTNPNPGAVGTCDAAADTYVGTSNSIRSPSFTKVYDTFLITVGTLSAGTVLTVNTTVVVSKAGTGSGGSSGSGTVSANNGSAGAVANYAAAGGSTTVGPDATLTDAGTTLIYSGTGGIQAGVAGSVGGKLCGAGATSGVTCLSWPAIAGTITQQITVPNALLMPLGTGAGINFPGGAFSLSSGQQNGGAGNLMQSATAPSIAAAGCGGAAASIQAQNGTAVFKINVGTTPGSACTITMPTAATGWNVTCNDITTQSTSVFVQKQTGAESTTSVTITNFSDVAAATAFVASDILKCTAAAD